MERSPGDGAADDGAAGDDDGVLLADLGEDGVALDEAAAGADGDFHAGGAGVVEGAEVGGAHPAGGVQEGSVEVEGEEVVAAGHRRRDARFGGGMFGVAAAGSCGRLGVHADGGGKGMRTMTKCVVGAAAVLAVAGAAMGQGALEVVTDASGTHVRPLVRAPWAVPGPGTDALLWTYNHPVAIAQSVALSDAGQSAWVGQMLNAEALQRFAFDTSGIPTLDTPGGPESPMLVAAADSADLGVVLDLPAAPAPGSWFQLRAYNAAGTPLWTRDFPEIYDAVREHNVQVSRDGSTVVVGLSQGSAASMLYFLSGADGSILQTWPGETGTIGSVDVTEDGSHALILHAQPNATARLISRATGQETFSAGGSGVGAAYKVSGDGTVVVMGGFSFNVWKNTGGSWSQVINFTQSGNWFGSGLAVSRDGSTAATLSHNYANGYLSNDVRVFDVATATLLGTYSTAGSGSYQSSSQGAEMSDDGSRLAVACWGTQIEGPPEVMVLDRTANLIDSIDAPGSVFSVDITGDGRYVLAGSKAVHANVFGNGGNAYLLDLGATGGCYANCDESTTAPVLNVADFTCFLNRFAAGESYANCDNSTLAPVLNVADFTCFLQSFAAGCP